MSANVDREIKFRAWDLEEKKMVDVTSAMNWAEVILAKDTNFIPMQFTGLHDKNGKEIYERDLLRWHDEVLEVKWGSVGWVLIGNIFKRFGSPPAPACSEINTIGYAVRSEIIGNVLENPELLNEKH